MIEKLKALPGQVGWLLWGLLVILFAVFVGFALLPMIVGGGMSGIGSTINSFGSGLMTWSSGINTTNIALDLTKVSVTRLLINAFGIVLIVVVIGLLIRWAVYGGRQAAPPSS